jgi:hypothetical protein
MTTLGKYLEDIAVAVLQPLGYLYGPVGATEGISGYSGISQSLDTQEWLRICTVEVPQYVGLSDNLKINAQPVTAAVPVYELYYIQVDGQQASYWVKRG